ncbi:MAG: four helix bundle protein [Patescibacteria group bacterium]
MPKKNKNKDYDYDLEERLAKFAERVIDTVKKLPKNCINIRLITQIVGSSGSSGANYCEACEAESKKDFKHKIRIVKKELRESKHWIRLIARANSRHKQECREIWQETHELLLIFAKILSSCK